MSRDNIQIMDNQAFSIRATPSASVLSNTEQPLLTSREFQGVLEEVTGQP